MTKRFCTDYATVIRFDIADLSAARSAASAAREQGLHTRLVYRGPREKIKCWRTGGLITPAYTVKANATAADLYIYHKK